MRDIWVMFLKVLNYLKAHEISYCNTENTCTFLPAEITDVAVDFRGGTNPYIQTPLDYQLHAVNCDAQIPDP